MRALTFAEYGPASVLEVTTVPDPHAGPGQVRIAVRAAGVNPIDWKVRAGHVKEFMPVEFPAIPGLDAAGVVDEVGEGVSSVTVGDEVFGLGNNVTAEFAVLDQFERKPASLSWEQAAGIGAVAETAQRTLDALALTPGQTLLIEGAAGGVGSTAAQLAVASGLAVIGTASSSNHEYLRSLGVMPTTYGPGLAERVAELAPNGVDGVLDTAGSGSLPELIRISQAPENVISIVDFTAPEYGARTSSGIGEESRGYHGFATVARLADEGRFTVAIDSTYPLEDAARAHERSETGHVRGKVVITVAQD